MKKLIALPKFPGDGFAYINPQTVSAMEKCCRTDARDLSDTETIVYCDRGLSFFINLSLAETARRLGLELAEGPANA